MGMPNSDRTSYGVVRLVESPSQTWKSVIAEILWILQLMAFVVSFANFKLAACRSAVPKTGSVTIRHVQAAVALETT